MIDFSAEKYYQWFYWTQKLLEPVEKLSVRMSIMILELATLNYKQSTLALNLYSLKAIAGKDPVGV